MRVRQFMILSIISFRLPVSSSSFGSLNFITTSWPSEHFHHDTLFNVHFARTSSSNLISCPVLAVSSSSTLLGGTSSRSSAAEHEINNRRRRRIGVIGGGASGMFAATAAADAVKRYMPMSHLSSIEKESIGVDVIVFEGTSKTMSKVRISGGGRCNGECQHELNLIPLSTAAFSSNVLKHLFPVMHDKTKPLPQILASYPRGHKELQGLYTKRFTPEDAYNWFISRGVQLKTESDGRMFPITDDSQTIIDTISCAATRAGVKVRMKEKVESVEWQEASHDGIDGGGKYVVTTSSKLSDSSERRKSEEQFDALILATGSFPLGHEIARSLGHTIIQPVPSLFTFDAKDSVMDGGVFHGLAGVAVPLARLSLVVNDEMISSENNLSSEQPEGKVDTAKKKPTKKKKPTIISQEGPLLITHHGVSGPAALRLSAFAAREFNTLGYKCEVKIHFCPKWEEEQNAPKSSSSESVLMDTLWEMTRLIPKRQVSTGCPLFMNGIDVNSKGGDPTKSVPMPIIPKRLWSALVLHSEIPLTTTWGAVSKNMVRSLVSNLTAFPLRCTSKGVFKDEFVTAGGVSLREVQMSNMRSKVKPGLFICGEVLDVDGVTGGYNFMSCWSTGFVAGEGAAEFCHDERLNL